jgi:hypothetical protein
VASGRSHEQPDAGFDFGRYVVVTVDGATLRGEAALTAIYAEAKRLSEELR